MAKKLLFIINPRAGKAQIKNRLVQILDLFTKYHYEVTEMCIRDSYRYEWNVCFMIGKIAIKNPWGSILKGKLLFLTIYTFISDTKNGTIIQDFILLTICVRNFLWGLTEPIYPQGNAGLKPPSR